MRESIRSFWSKASERERKREREKEEERERGEGGREGQRGSIDEGIYRMILQGDVLVIIGLGFRV